MYNDGRRDSRAATKSAQRRRCVRCSWTDRIAAVAVVNCVCFRGRGVVECRECVCVLWLWGARVDRAVVPEPIPHPTSPSPPPPSQQQHKHEKYGGTTPALDPTHPVFTGLVARRAVEQLDGKDHSVFYIAPPGTYAYVGCGVKCGVLPRRCVPRERGAHTQRWCPYHQAKLTFRSWQICFCVRQISRVPLS